MSLTKVTYSMINGAAVNVLDYGVVADGITNNSVALAAALAAVPTNGTLYFPAGVYCGYLLVWRGDITIMGSGSASTILKLPTSCPTITVPWESGGTITGLPNVIEVGECALGNIANAYSNVVVKNITLDGNYTNNTAPTTDLFGHGLISTKISNLVLDDVVSKNCFLTGVDVVINSNYARVNARVDSCGNAVISGSRYPNFDINSSKYGLFNVISTAGYYGGRMLDNCYGNQLDITIYNPSITGLVYNNQTTNASYSNTINVTVVDGCATGQGVSIGSNCYDSIINATVRNVVGTGFYVVGASAAFASRNNKFKVNTYYCGGSSVYDAGLFNQYEISSRWDGRTGAAGSVFAVDINGSYSQFIINVEDQNTPQVRGVAIRSGAQYNRIVDYLSNTTVQNFLNQDTSNTNVWNYDLDALFLGKLTIGAGGATVSSGSGSPEGAVTAVVGSLFMRTNGGANTTLYVKESGTGNTGWAAK
jgi:hypothetical protein